MACSCDAEARCGEHKFPYEVIDLDSDESQGTYETLDEARGCVRFNRLRCYSIWRNDIRVEFCDPYDGDDDRVKQALGLPNESEYEPDDLSDRSIPSDPLFGQRMDSADMGEN